MRGDDAFDDASDDAFDDAFDGQAVMMARESPQAYRSPFACRYHTCTTRYSVCGVRADPQSCVARILTDHASRSYFVAAALCP